MNGVSRFLSRREKHHEKRHSKHTRPSKVLQPFFSPPSLLQDTLGSVGLFSSRRKPPYTDLTPLNVQASTTESDLITLQAQPVPANLYTIFSNDELRVDKEDEKKKVGKS